ncbi:unnamed protein product [Rotaria sordida]|uniref:Uncharacterized protein n=1 Tax=Rotaria sordida TaxID=392033 RepID=A0A814WFM9_9BILA|nr:unnamed protein product [Rotaria sordida]
MPFEILSVDTSVLPTDVLSLYDDSFYRLVEIIAGPAEANLLESQGIRSVYSFLNTEDVFHVLSIQCSALNNIKKSICLEADDNTFTVKPGCRRNKQSQLPQNNDTTTNLSQDPSETAPTSAAHQQYTGTLGDDNTFTVKPGCRSNIRYLYQLLYQKQEEHLKKITHKSKGNKRSQLSQNNDTTTNLSQDPSETSPTSATHQQYTGTLG